VLWSRAIGARAARDSGGSRALSAQQVLPAPRSASTGPPVALETVSSRGRSDEDLRGRSNSNSFGVTNNVSCSDPSCPPPRLQVFNLSPPARLILTARKVEHCASIRSRPDVNQDQQAEQTAQRRGSFVGAK